MSADGLRPSALVLVFALLAAAGGTAAAKDSGSAGPPRDDATEVEVEVEGPAEDRRPPTEAKPHETAPPPAPGPRAEAVPAPLGPTDDGRFLRPPVRAHARRRGGGVPGARVQVDGGGLPAPDPQERRLPAARPRRAHRLARAHLLLRRVRRLRARAAARQRPLAPSALPATDKYAGAGAVRRSLILQAGQFDVPFTLENRTSDAYTDVHRARDGGALAGRARNKEVGAMAHGLLADGASTTPAGMFNGDGPDFRNFDNSPTPSGARRSPFAARRGVVPPVALGGSGWYGSHVLGPTFPSQATPGGMPFLAPAWITGQPAARRSSCASTATVTAFGGELNLPLGTRFGMRGEGVFKRQQLAETDSAGQRPGQAIGPTATLSGIAGYGEMWLWLAGRRAHAAGAGAGAAGARQRPRRARFEDGLHARAAR